MILSIIPLLKGFKLNKYQDSSFIQALNRQNQGTTPIWLMRQAGRYLPEYRKVRAEAKDFWTLCKTPELACEVTLQPLRRYDLDAAIVFSDILTIPDAIGFELKFEEKKGPVFHKTFRAVEDLKQLKQHDAMSRLAYVFDAVAMCRANMPSHLPLIGFSGSPWTLACYMVEGQSSKNFSEIFQMLYRAPELIRHLLDILRELVAVYLIEQVNHGANALMLFDTWGGILPSDAYQKLNLPDFEYIVQRIKTVHPDTPVVIFGKNNGFYLQELASTGCQGIGIDWTVDIAKANALVGNKVSLQGNLHPEVLKQSPEVIQSEALKILRAYGNGPGHVFNLGHGITPDVPPEAVQILIETVHQYQKNQ